MGYFTLFFHTKCSKSRAYFTLSTHHTSIQPSFISRTQQLHVLVAIILDNAGQYQDIPHEKVLFAFLSGEQYNQSHLIPVASCGSRPASVNQLVKKKQVHVYISFMCLFHSAPVSGLLSAEGTQLMDVFVIYLAKFNRKAYRNLP